MTSPALCEVCTDSGRETALVATGICRKCNKAFCTGHAVVDQWGVPFDLCKPCRAAERVAEASSRKTEIDQSAAELARIRELVQLLDAAGVQPTERHETERRWKKKIFGKGYTPNRGYVDVRVAIEPAWPVGELRWKAPSSWEYGDDYSTLASGITRKLKIVPMLGKPGALRPFYGFSHEQLDGHSVLERSPEVRRQVIKALERRL